MRIKTLLAVAALPAVMFGASPAEAHFKLEVPADWLQTDSAGDPLGTGGTQKMNPCGQGTPSGIITRVVAGSTLHVKLTETVPHGGHYRIALVPKYNPVSTDIPEPAVTPAGGTTCDSAAIENPPVAPVLADNLFPHTQAEAVSGKVWETDVVLPNTTGPATLQIIEFMTPHAPPCFYHHCAQLDIVSPDAGAGDGGVVVIGPDGGVVGDDGGGTGGGGDASSPDSGSYGPHPSNGATSSSSGCSAGGNAAPTLVPAAWLFVAIAFSAIRRRAKK